MLMEVKKVFGGGEWGLFCGVLVVERWWNGGCRVERERGEGRERKSLGVK